MKKIITTAVVIASACGVFGAREIWAENTTSHAVQKGDTLWDLSGAISTIRCSGRKSGGQPRDRQPHRITPGQVIKIPGMERAPAREVREVAVVSDVVPVESGPSPLARAGWASSSEPLPVIVGKKDLPPASAQARAGQVDDPARYYDRGIGMVSNEIPTRGGCCVPKRAGRARLSARPFSSLPWCAGWPAVRGLPGFWQGRVSGYFERSPGHLLADIAIVEVVALDATRQQAVIRRAYAEVRTDDLLGQVPERPTVSGPFGAGRGCHGHRLGGGVFISCGSLPDPMILSI